MINSKDGQRAILGHCVNKMNRMDLIDKNGYVLFMKKISLMVSAILYLLWQKTLRCNTYDFICVPRSSDRHQSINYSLHAVIEMVEPTHQSRLKGGGFKLPKGAMVKSHGVERLGNGRVTSVIRYE
jgi:hypothetical protein